MAYHSEEVWENFEALWRRVQTISRRMGELEMKIRVLEQEAPTQYLQETSLAGSATEGGGHK